MSGWISEDEFFDRRRRYERKGRYIRIVEKKWSEGSSPYMMVKFEEYTKERI